MAGQKQPIEVVIAKGKKHLSKKEIETRRNSELKVDLKDIQVPKYLSAKLKKEFEDLAMKLLDINIMTELDEDCLANYLMAKERYLKFSKMLNKATKEKDIRSMESLTSMQDKALKQCRAFGNDLGLSITSRCKLVVPPPKDPPIKKNKFIEKFGNQND